MSIDSPIRPEAARRDAMQLAFARNLSRPDISLISENTYCVLSAEETMGYVDKVGNVFVAHSGGDLSHAVEVGQSLSWDEAVSMVVRAFTSRRAASRQRGA
ncbi:hypothetical protein BH11ACT4_BH11ACT4_20930 [soil metagenome]